MDRQATRRMGGAEVGDVVTILAFRQDHAVDIQVIEDVQIIAMRLAADRVDPHPPFRLAVAALGEQAQKFARQRLLRRRDAVLQVEDDGVRLAGQRLHHLLVAVRGDEQPAARRRGAGVHAGFLWSRADRFIVQTVSPRWLIARCSQVTIPAVGRELLSRVAVTSLSKRSVSPMKTGFGKRTSSKPRLAINVPRVVSATDTPTTRLKVKQLLTRICPNSLAFAASASRCIGCALWVRVEMRRLSASVTVRVIA